jgi:uncharacterized protein YkwD
MSLYKEANMSKRALSIILLAGIVLTACGGQATQVTESRTAIPATTAPPATTAAPATNTPTEAVVPVTGESPTSSATPTVFVPTNEAGCVNKATFVSDVTIPDNTDLTAGTTFTKTWRVQNSGTCIWWSGYTLTHYSGETFSAPASIPLPVTNPGETADISIDLVAPSAVGKYQGWFVIKNPEGLIMQIDNDSRLWLIVNVGAAPTGTPTVAPTATTAAGSSTATSTATSSTPGTPASSAGGSGFANVTCAFTTDAARAQQVADAINAYRSQNNLIPYNVNPQLSQAAQAHADDMACNHLFSHNGSNGSTPETRVAASGYVYTFVSENVYGSDPQLTPDGVVTWWKTDQTDPTHNKNLISTDYVDIGVGYAFFNNYGYYVVDFATP